MWEPSTRAVDAVELADRVQFGKRDAVQLVEGADQGVAHW